MIRIVHTKCWEHDFVCTCGESLNSRDVGSTISILKNASIDIVRSINELNPDLISKIGDLIDAIESRDEKTDIKDLRCNIRNFVCERQEFIEKVLEACKKVQDCISKL